MRNKENDLLATIDFCLQLSMSLFLCKLWSLSYIGSYLEDDDSLPSFLILCLTLSIESPDLTGELQRRAKHSHLLTLVQDRNVSQIEMTQFLNHW